MENQGLQMALWDIKAFTESVFSRIFLINPRIIFDLNSLFLRT